MSELTEGNQGCGLIEVENTLDGTENIEIGWGAM